MGCALRRRAQWNLCDSFSSAPRLACEDRAEVLRLSRLHCALDRTLAIASALHHSAEDHRHRAKPDVPRSLRKVPPTGHSVNYIGLSLAFRLVRLVRLPICPIEEEPEQEQALKGRLVRLRESVGAFVRGHLGVQLESLIGSSSLPHAGAP
eukprot:scaffold2277_cov256-Pinguiococcus_pyrenoidosus.AAC.14